MRALSFAALSTFLIACGTSSTETPDDAGAHDGGANVDATTPDGSSSGGGTDGGGTNEGGGTSDGGTKPVVDAGPQDTTCAGPCPTSSIKHVVIIVQENHTFDNHFGGYCKATPGSNPTCNDGPACCEAMPASDPKGVAPVTLDDTEEAQFDPNHTKACELTEINGGAMDGYAAATSACGSANNVAISDPSIIKPYWDLAAQNAIADRYFQPLVGQSSANDMYLARASWVFDDNSAGPQGAVGDACDIEGTLQQFTGPTIGDLLTTATVPWTWFSGGYQAMVTAGASCPPKPSDCGSPFAFYPCAFDPSDVPFEYYASTLDNPATLKDLTVFQAILSGTGDLPAVSFVKPIGYESEHPGYGSTLSAGVNRVAGLIAAVQASRYASDTLVVLTYDEGGGFFDHVAPPAQSAVDNEPYGTRIPMMAIGPFTKTNFVSHVVMEHSSLVKFIEWNWLGGTTGQLGKRDAVVANIGSMLDSTKTGVAVPEN